MVKCLETVESFIFLLNFSGLTLAIVLSGSITSNSIEKNDSSGKLIEFPLLVTTFLGKKIPAAGGFYLRTLPIKVIKNALKNYQNKNIPGSFYIHSWELTPEFMPKLDLPFKDKFATYHNLGKAYSRMSELLKSFKFTSFERYLNRS